MFVKTFGEFINEGKKGLTPAGTVVKTDQVTKVGTSINYQDETLEGLRRKFIDIFRAKIDQDDEEAMDTVNKCASTIVYTLDKKMRIDEDIMITLSKITGISIKAINKIVVDEIDKHYSSSANIYGVT